MPALLQGNGKSPRVRREAKVEEEERESERDMRHVSGSAV